MLKRGGFIYNMRIFIAIRLEDRIISNLKELADSLSPNFVKARMTAFENYHITLQFIGESDRKTFNQAVLAVKETAASAERFSVITNGPGSFKRKNKHIFYCGVGITPQLMKIHENIKQNLRKNGVSFNDGRFTPHITLAREAVIEDGYPDVQYEPVEIKVNEIHLMESTRINGKLTYISRYKAELGG